MQSMEEVANLIKSVVIIIARGRMATMIDFKGRIRFDNASLTFDKK